jgi:hypothetical protein
MDAPCPDAELWCRVHCLAFDDVMREVCDIGPRDGSPLLGEARALCAEFLRLFAHAGTGGQDAALAARVAHLLRGTLFVRFGEQVLYWLERLPAVDAEYRRRLRFLQEGPARPDTLRRYVDRGEPAG